MDKERRSYMRILIYGSTPLLSETCPTCKRESFVNHINAGLGKTICCEALVPIPEVTIEWTRMSVTTKKRKTLPYRLKKQILTSQGNRCLYCNINFNVPVYRNGKQVRRSISFDHFVPIAYAFNNNRPNVVAACSICNSMKSDLLFETLDDCIRFLTKNWLSRRYTITRPAILVPPEMAISPRAVQ
jgi:5-methylcytosine-specific restriction endonuclease McrA